MHTWEYHFLLQGPESPMPDIQNTSDGPVTGNRPPRQRKGMDITRVQQWVMSSLLVTTVAHFAAGLVLVAVFQEESRNGSRIGLLVNAGLVGVAAMAGALLIHRRSWLSPLLLLGFLPTVVGAVIIYGF